MNARVPSTVFDRTDNNADQPSRHDVGYGKPPKKHRFKKGQSGSPGGRPKGATNKPRQFDPGHQPTDGLILEEAYRMVTIREGDKVIELPAIQASVRSLAIAAMKGSRLSQRALAELVRQVEDRKANELLSAMENALEYKERWTSELARRKARGVIEPDPIPHPDDIIINMRNGDVRTDGPLDEMEKRRWDERLARRAEAQAEVDIFAEKYRRARCKKRKGFWLQEWHFEQKIFDIINDGMPVRYKAKLNNRSYREGATREGRALDEYRQAQARRSSKAR